MTVPSSFVVIVPSPSGKMMGIKEEVQQIWTVTMMRGTNGQCPQEAEEIKGVNVPLSKSEKASLNSG
jgi:hypothetical protein